MTDTDKSFTISYYIHFQCSTVVEVIDLSHKLINMEVNIGVSTLTLMTINDKSYLLSSNKLVQFPLAVLIEATYFDNAI